MPMRVPYTVKQESPRTFNIYPWVIIMPAFNEICGGVTFNSSNKRLLGPIATKLLRLNDMKAYLLDGTYIGKVGDLD